MITTQANRWLVYLQEQGQSASTRVSRQAALRRFSSWCAREGLTAEDALTTLQRPKLQAPVMEPLSEDELRALLKACAGTTLRARRDEALVRLLMETGMRAGEASALQVLDVDLAAGIATIHSGKGGKGRVVGFGPQTSQALSRYMRLRRQHRLADTPALWVGDRRKGFNYYALHAALAKRAKAAGIQRFRPHLLRNTWAHRWLVNQGSQSGLMAAAGWTRPEMLVRYTKFHEQQRAVEEAHRLNLGAVG